MLSICILLPFSAEALEILTDKHGNTSSQPLSLPYAFYNESFGLAAGYVYGVVGKPQPQSSLLGTVMAGSQGSAMGFLIGKDLRLPWSERLFLDPVISVGYFRENDLYIDGNAEYANSRSGSNDSDADDYVVGNGWDNFFRLKFKYLLPVGEGKDTIITYHKIDRGLPIQEKAFQFSFNPFTSGKSFLEMKPFYRSQSVESDTLDRDIQTNGIDTGLYWDNRDFGPNPSQGFSARFKVSRDFGGLDSSGSWTNMDGEIDAYFSLGKIRNFRQQVLALNVWTSYSPSWSVQPDGTIANRPPAYTGSTLGGIWRMRGYPSQRFSDKAAIYYGAEWRLIPEWNPFTKSEWLQRYVGVQWLQIVPFAEIGRVSPSWNLEDLHQDMKWSLGVGIRAWAKGIVARIDTAYSDEDFKIQMMVGHPFQF